MSQWSIIGKGILTPDKFIKKAGIVIDDGIIEKIDSHSSFTVEADGIIVPGFINSHDHLIGNYYPKVGNGPYENWLPWDNDLKSSPIYEERQQIENRDLYLLAGYRNLLSGVTTISDHIPHFVHEPFLDIMPIKVLRNYALAHSVVSFALIWGDDISVEYQKAAKEKVPFITHSGEGFDDETIHDIDTLERLGALGEYTVLIHGIAFNENDIKRIKKAGASVVWCGDSNMFMFNKTANIKLMLAYGVNVCIGTDSPMSGGENLLHEIKFDRKLYKKLFNEELSDETIVRMITVNPSYAFKLSDHGSINPGNVADFVVISRTEDNPYSAVVNAQLEDIALVVINGKPMYGDSYYKQLFDYHKVKYQEIVLRNKQKIVVGDLSGLLRRISKVVGYKKEFPFIPVEFDI